MDTSQTYINMCEKATEIQREWNEIDEVNFFCIWCKTHKAMFIRDYEDNWCYRRDIRESPEKCDYVFLPRQDQLQEMVGLPMDELWTGLVEFAGYMIDEYQFIEPKYEHYSFEQLWLAFVMKEKYNKVWNGTDWVKE